MMIFSGNDPEATGFGMSGSIALEMPKWLKRAGIKIVAISPDLNHAGAVHADKWIPIKPNTDAAMMAGMFRYERPPWAGPMQMVSSA